MNIDTIPTPLYTHPHTHYLKAFLPLSLCCPLSVSRFSGTWVRKSAKPYVSYARVLATPVVVSFQVAFGAGAPTT